MKARTFLTELHTPQDRFHDRKTLETAPDAVAVVAPVMEGTSAVSVTEETENKESSTTTNATVLALQFPWKLHQMLEATTTEMSPMVDSDDNNPNKIVSWLPCGNGFQIHNKVKFCKQIMPVYFKSTTYKSFHRSLNLWGFVTVRKGIQKGAISNRYFVRGHPDLCHLMTRIKTKKEHNRKTRMMLQHKQITTNTTTTKNKNVIEQERTSFSAHQDTAGDFPPVPGQKTPTTTRTSFSSPPILAEDFPPETRAMVTSSPPSDSSWSSSRMSTSSSSNSSSMWETGTLTNPELLVQLLLLINQGSWETRCQQRSLSATTLLLQQQQLYPSFFEQQQQPQAHDLVTRMMNFQQHNPYQETPVAASSGGGGGEVMRGDPMIAAAALAVILGSLLPPVSK